MQPRTNTRRFSTGNDALKLLMLAGLLVGLWFCLTSSACNNDPGFGDPLMKKAGVPAGTADYAFVADSRRQLYWPNEARYVNRIPKANRVWIKDAATLAQFKGYQPGDT